ncbi:PaaX family transcriptional regulator C-terminal domain-containing protein [Martelella alba]|nr:PaaX family transcriptional regulator C-terminal domain-containing protein [Martelella alba]
MPFAFERQSDLPDAVTACLDMAIPRATAFIVTLYGDVAVPRGGRLWMGTLIETCADHGISESLVRTAVSRLVESGRLEGERQGRKSYYRLAAAARQEFLHAAAILYDPAPAPDGFLVALGFGDAPLSDDWVGIGADVALAPNRSDIERPQGAILAAEALAGGEALVAAARRYWPLDEVSERYTNFVDRFAPVAAALADGFRPAGPVALALRLRLVHLYRFAALLDPRLPANALPPDFCGGAARRLFVRLYLALSPAADGHVGAHFMDDAGAVPAETAATLRRLSLLKRESLR